MNAQPDLIRFDTLTPRPWPNGLGTTTEVARDGGGEDDWTFRLSVARIDADTPFSALPGVDRSLMALGPAALTLVVGGTPKVLQPHDVLRFTGEDTIVPAGVVVPGLDLNLMTRRGRATGTLELVSIVAGQAFDADPATRLALVLLEGTARVGDDELNRLDTVLGAPGATVAADGDARLALLRIQSI